jgi:hypothetical protein
MRPQEMTRRRGAGLRMMRGQGRRAQLGARRRLQPAKTWPGLRPVLLVVLPRRASRLQQVRTNPQNRRQR